MKGAQSPLESHVVEFSQRFETIAVPTAEKERKLFRVNIQKDFDDRIGT